MLLFLIVGNLILSIAAMGNPTSPVTYYLNQKPVDLKRIFLEVGTIDSITVDKSGGVGVVNITTKNNEFHFYRLSDILEKYPIIKEAGNRLVFRINDRLIPDTAGVKIDRNHEMDVTSEKLNAVEYLPDPLRMITIVNIELEKKETAQLPHVNVFMNTDDFAPIVRDFLERVARRRVQ